MPAQPSFLSYWTVCTSALEHEMPEQQFNTWIRPLQAVEGDGVLRLMAPNRFSVDWVNKNLLGRLAAILQEIAGCDVPFTVELNEWDDYNKPDPIGSVDCDLGMACKFPLGTVTVRPVAP
jgi:chromosomal replication initiator protein